MLFDFDKFSSITASVYADGLYTGKQIRRSFSGKTQKEVREKMQAAAVTVNDSTYQEPSKLTVSDWLDVWLSEYTGDV